MTRIRHIRLSRPGIHFRLSPPLSPSPWKFAAEEIAEKEVSAYREHAPRAEDGDLRSYKSRAWSDAVPTGIVRRSNALGTVSGGGYTCRSPTTETGYWNSTIIEGSSILCLFWYVSVDSEMVHLSCIPGRERDWMDGFMRTSLQMNRRIHVYFGMLVFDMARKIKLPVLLKSDFFATFPFTLELYNYRHVKYLKF